MKKIAKLSSIILVVAIITLVFSNTIAIGASDPSTVINQLNPNYSENATTGITSLGQKIISYISIAAIVIAVIVLLILGIKYMIGSASEKAEYKKTMIPYLVGAVLVFGAGAIAQVIVQVTSNLTAGN